MPRPDILRIARAARKRTRVTPPWLPPPTHTRAPLRALGTSPQVEPAARLAKIGEVFDVKKGNT